MATPLLILPEDRNSFRFYRDTVALCTCVFKKRLHKLHILYYIVIQANICRISERADMKNFFRKFMQDRYGPDHLGVALIILSFIISVLYVIIGHFPLLFLSYFIFGLVLFRMLSRNIVNRRRENDIFIRYWWPIRTKIKRFIGNLKQRKTHKIFKCPACKNRLRVPRGKGKITVTCPKCTKKIPKKT